MGEISTFLGGRRAGFQALPARGGQHPSLDEPPAEGWDDGPPRDPGWFDLRESDVEIEALAEDVLAVKMRSAGAGAVGVRLERDPGDRFWGFGARSDASERRDGVVENWVGEGPYQLEEYRLVEAITPRWAIR